jgi:SAM-dependent methyltransferase
VTTAPWPSDAELDAAYAGPYRPATGRFAGAGDKTLRALRARLARRLDRIAPPGRVLDVGAGDGTLVDALARRGRDAVGLERRSDHPRIRVGEPADLEPGFAAVVFWHSLEHLRRPGEALAQTAALLDRGGVLVAALPNTDSIQARALGERWLAIDSPRHLVHVPARALLARLEELGLRVERVSHLRGGQVVFGWLHGLVGLLPGSPSLWNAIRRPEGRSEPMRGPERALALGAGVVLLPLAATCAGLEAALRRGGSVYVEARRP